MLALYTRLRTVGPLQGLVFAGMFAASLMAEESGDSVATDAGTLRIHPISHATMVLQWGGQVIYLDPVGGGETFAGLPAPTGIFITDIHGDHFDTDTLESVTGSDTWLIAPAAVAAKMPEPLREKTHIMANGEESTISGIRVRAIPMYNLTEERLKYHAKGRGNGYLMTFGGRRVYIAGDTEDIPEMRSLEEIDIAFIPMNLPYTMTVEQAADAVLDFRPDIVYPYHYRGSDVEKFKSLVEKGTGSVDVRLRSWY